MDPESTKAIVDRLRESAAADAIGGNPERALVLQKRATLLESTTTTPPKRITGTWICSCGMETTLDIKAGEISEIVANGMLDPHKRPGHQLRRIK